jgi:hypothetical protein
MTLTRLFNPTIVEHTKKNHSKYTHLVVGSEESGSELGRTGYDPIPHNCIWKRKKGFYQTYFISSPQYMIIITNIFFYHECVQDNGLNVIALE